MVLNEELLQQQSEAWESLGNAGVVAVVKAAGHAHAYGRRTLNTSSTSRVCEGVSTGNGDTDTGFGTTRSYVLSAH